MTQNPEVPLWDEFYAAAMGKPEPHPNYPEYLNPNYDNLTFRIPAGSQNWHIMAYGARYYRFQDGTSLFQRCRNEILANLKDEEGRYQTTECFSMIYFGFTVMPRLAMLTRAMALGDHELTDALARHLGFLAAVLQVVYDDGAYRYFGQRSAGFPPDGDPLFHGQHNVLHEMGEIARGVTDRPNTVGGKTDAMDILSRHLPSWRYAITELAGKVGRDAIQLLNFKTVTPYYVLRTDQGTAIYTTQRVNQNTASVLGYSRVGGTSTYLPYRCGFDPSIPNDRRDRIHGPESCHRDGDKLVYDSSIYGHNETVLPQGSVIEYFQFGGASGYADMSGFSDPANDPTNQPAPPVNPPNDTPPPDSTSFWERLTAWYRRHFS